MHICIEIIFSELYLQLCQIYKYPPQVSFSFFFFFHVSCLGQHHTQHLFGRDFVFSHLFAQIVFPYVITSHHILFLYVVVSKQNNPV